MNKYTQVPRIDANHVFLKDEKTNKIVKTFSNVIENPIKLANYLNEFKSRSLLRNADNRLAHILVHGECCAVSDYILGISMTEYNYDDVNLHCPLPTETTLFCLNDLINLIYVLQKNDIMWMDLKIEQFIFSSKHNKSFKILDFEDCQPCEVWRKHNLNFGTVFYQAPEQRHQNVKKNNLNPHAIMTFQMGLILLIMAIDPSDDFFLSQHWTTKETFNKHLQVTIELADRTDLPQNFWDLVYACLNYEAIDRPTCEELVDENKSWNSLLKASTGRSINRKRLRSNNIDLPMTKKHDNLSQSCINFLNSAYSYEGHVNPEKFAVLKKNMVEECKKNNISISKCICKYLDAWSNF